METQLTFADLMVRLENEAHDALMERLGDENPRDYEHEDHEQEQHEFSLEGIENAWN